MPPTVAPPPYLATGGVPSTRTLAPILAPDDVAAARRFFDAWFKQLRRHRALPGDHKGNPVVRFFWKGAGVLGPEAFPAQPFLAKLEEYGSPHGVLVLSEDHKEGMQAFKEKRKAVFRGR